MKKIQLKKNIVLWSIEDYFQRDLKKEEKIILYMEKTYVCNEKLIGKLKIKIIKVKMLNVMIETILNQISEIKRESFFLRYRNHMEWVGISMRLHVSVAQLNIWNNEILKLIENFMCYKITKQDLLHLNKVWLMYDVLHRQVILLSLKPYKSFVDKKFISRLINKQHDLLYLNVVICDYIANLVNPMEQKILIMKLCDVHIANKGIAQKCEISISLAGTYIARFKNVVMKQYESRLKTYPF